MFRNVSMSWPYTLSSFWLHCRRSRWIKNNDRDKYLHLARETMKRQLAAMVALKADGVEVFEYGTSIRKECMDAGFPREEAMKIKDSLLNT